MRSLKGFTLVELVLVILLIGIVSAVGSSLFTRKSSFSGFTARDQLVAVAQLAQKRALALVDSANPVTLVLSQQADNWVIGLSQGTTSFRNRMAERVSASVSVNGVTMLNGATQTITFNSSGETGSNTQFVFSGTSTYSLCISSAGFAYPGTCQP